MQASVALLRGINVGGNNILPMAELKDIFAALGAQDVRTYIQSGNVVYRGTKPVQQKISNELVAEILRRKGYKVSALLYDAAQFTAIIEENPYTRLTEDAAKLHAGFLTGSAHKADVAKLEALKHAGEQYHVGKHAFYLYAPEGIGRSKLAAGAEKALGVPMTMRNWKTVNGILAMLHS